MLKLEIDQPIKVKLLKQQPRPDTGKFPGNIYTLEVNGVVEDYRATDNVHSAIQEKVREGMTFELVKRTHKDYPDRTVIWVNVEEPSGEYFGEKSDEDIPPVLQRVIDDANMLVTDMKDLTEYFKQTQAIFQKPADNTPVAPNNDPIIPF